MISWEKGSVSDSMSVNIFFLLVKTIEKTIVYLEKKKINNVS